MTEEEIAYKAKIIMAYNEYSQKRIDDLKKCYAEMDKAFKDYKKKVESYQNAKESD